MKLRKKVKRSLVYMVVRLLVSFLNVVPRTMAIYIGSWFGLLFWHLSGHDRYRVGRHLALVYGDRFTPRQRSNIGRSYYIKAGRNLADVMRFKKHFADEIRPLVETEGMEYIEAAMARGRGMVGITGHIGNFELLAAFVQSEGYPVAVIGREMYDPRLDRLLLENRRAVGLTNIATTESPKRIFRWLKNGGAIGVLIDTDSHRVRGAFIPAFGRWSYTPVGQSIIGLKTGSAFVPMACLRTDDDRYRLVVKPPIEIEPSGDFDTDVYNLTLKCTRALEEIIDAHKDQWIWQHNKWRTRRVPLDSGK